MAETEETHDYEAIKFMIDNACRCATMVSVEQAAALINQMEHITTVLPFTDPTAFMKIADNARDHIRVARAFLTFRKAIQDIAGR